MEREIKKKCIKCKRLKLIGNKSKICDSCMNFWAKNINKDILKTSEEWNKEWKFKILDYDGWNRQNLQYSFHEEKITLKEFHYRIMMSTTTFQPVVIKKDILTIKK